MKYCNYDLEREYKDELIPKICYSTCRKFRTILVSNKKSSKIKPSDIFKLPKYLQDSVKILNSSKASFMAQSLVEIRHGSIVFILFSC